MRIGYLVPGGETPIGEGVNRPTRATVLVDGQRHAAIVKRLPTEAVLAECFAALLLAGWGLPVPEPVLIVEARGLAFASLDAGYPNLKQRLGWRDDLPDDRKAALTRLGAAIVCAWSDAPLALTVDEAIANADRNLGNILWDGVDHAWIDHERCLGQAPKVENLLACLARLAGREADMEQGAVAASLTLDRGLPARIDAPEGVDFSALSEYVEKRLPTLASRILARFPKPQDLLAGLDPP